jgi:hypothetical protein
LGLAGTFRTGGSWEEDCEGDDGVTTIEGVDAGVCIIVVAGAGGIEGRIKAEFKGVIGLSKEYPDNSS